MEHKFAVFKMMFRCGYVACPGYKTLKLTCGLPEWAWRIIFKVECHFYPWKAAIAKSILESIKGK